jgi:hypothetical protein
MDGRCLRPPNDFERHSLIAAITGHSMKAVQEILAGISQRIRRIGAPNQRKLLCENDFPMIRGAPRCRQSVARNDLILEASKVGLWKPRSMPDW